MAKELYKRHRPKTLDRVVGNVGTVASLKNMLANKTLPHTILFHGPSGCGKTTLARILKTELGCKDMDFAEFNSASFRGVDTSRDVSRLMNLAPAGPCKVYLFDECHKWTKDAQEAMLKPLEDTPDHVYFFLCTTDPDKLVKAILTRCCEMPVSLLREEEMETLLDRVAGREKITLADDVKAELISSSQGSARTLLVLLDKISNLNPDQQKEAIALKLAEENEAIDLCRMLMNPKTPWKAVAKVLRNLKGEPEQIRYSVLYYAQSVLLNRGDWASYNIIKCFENNFYDGKMPSLTAACWEALNAKE